MTIIDDETGEEYESVAHLLADALGGDVEDYQVGPNIPYPGLDELKQKDVADDHETR